jgi:hypothetical protein
MDSISNTFSPLDLVDCDDRLSGVVEEPLITLNTVARVLLEGLLGDVVK